MSLSEKTIKARELFSKRLKIKLQECDLNQNELAKILNVSESTVGKWVLGKAMPRTMGLIQQIADHFNVGKSYFLELELAELPTKKILSHTIPHTVNETTSETDLGLPSSTYRYVPDAVAARSLTTIEGLTDLPLVTIPDCMLGRYARNKNIILMPVSGESMNNVICNGAIIAVLTKVELPQIKNGDIVVVSNNGDYTVKRFYNDTEHQEFIFRPDSSDMSYRDIIFSYDNCEDLRLVGKVVMYNVTL